MEAVLDDTLPRSSRSKMIVIWVLRIIVAALFLFAAFAKLSGQPMMVSEFKVIGLGDGFRFVTGAIELFGAILLLIPRASVFGAIVLLMVDLGAFVTQLFILHGDVIHTIVIGLVVGALVYLQRERLSMMGVHKPANQL